MNITVAMRFLLELVTVELALMQQGKGSSMGPYFAKVRPILCLAERAECRFLVTFLLLGAPFFTSLLLAWIIQQEF